MILMEWMQSLHHLLVNWHRGIRIVSRRRRRKKLRRRPRKRSQRKNLRRRSLRKRRLRKIRLRRRNLKKRRLRRRNLKRKSQKRKRLRRKNPKPRKKKHKKRKWNPLTLISLKISLPYLKRKVSPKLVTLETLSSSLEPHTPVSSSQCRFLSSFA